MGFCVRGGGVGIFKVRDLGFHVRCPGFGVRVFVVRGFTVPGFEFAVRGFTIEVRGLGF